MFEVKNFNLEMNSIISNNEKDISVSKQKVISSNNNMNSKINKRLGSLPENLKLHGSTPSGKPRLFVCTTCTRAFARQEHLARHKRSHTNERPYKCGICERNFTRRDLLLRHAQKVHNGNFQNDNSNITFKDNSIKDDSNDNNKSTSDGNNNNLNEKYERRPGLKNKEQQSKINGDSDDSMTPMNNVNICDSNKSNPTSSSISPFSLSNLTEMSSMTSTPILNIDNNSNISAHTMEKKPSFSSPSSISLAISKKKRNYSITKKQAQQQKQQQQQVSSGTNFNSKPRRHPIRRASFSAQSAENYALPVKHSDDSPTFDNIRFSTPTLLPIDLDHLLDPKVLPNISEYGANDSNNDNDINNTDDNRSSSLIYKKFGNLQQILDIPTEFSLAQVTSIDNEIINNFNNEPYYSPTIEQNILENNKSNNFNSNNNLFSKTNQQSFQQKFPDYSSFENYKISSKNSPKHLDPNIIDSLEQPTPALNNVPLSKTSSSSPTSLIFSNDNNSNRLLNNIILPSSSSSYKSVDIVPSITDQVHNSSNNDLLLDTDYNNDGDNANLIDKEFGELAYITSKYSRSIYDNFIKNEEEEINSPKNISYPNIKLLNNNYTFYGLDYLTMSNISKASPSSQTTSIINESTIETGEKSTLFTPKIYEYCHTILKYYLENCGNTNEVSNPVLLTKELLLPSCKELNQFLDLFKSQFLVHYPFIHQSLLYSNFLSFQKYLLENESLEECDVDYRKDRDILHISRTVCMPLLMASIGSLFKRDCKAKTITLYEISRRAIHIFLEAKKKKNIMQLHSGHCISEKKYHTQNTWLIQTLLLNIIFALFADELKNIEPEVVKRQVCAICSVVKSNVLEKVSEHSNSRLFNSRKEISFSNNFGYLLFESKIRATFMLYDYCQFLRVFYSTHSNHFLNENDIGSIIIPDDNSLWKVFSFNDIEKVSESPNPIKKENTVAFEKFYNSFAFSDRGLYPIPEAMAKSMMFYEFRSRNNSQFHIFLTRIDTNKLEINLPNSLGTESDDIFYSTFVDCTILKNCLMVMNFFFEVDNSFGYKIWKSQMNEVYETFLNSKNMNILENGSYNLLSDFLVSLNHSIQNISKVILKPYLESDTSIIDSTRITLFNLQGYYYNFLVLLKFILDFESTPNFKLLSIYTELNKMANKFLIPTFSDRYSTQFADFDDWDANLISKPEAMKKVLKLQKIINDVLIYSFNDASFLKMSSQSINEFTFSHDMKFSDSANCSQFKMDDSLDLLNCRHHDDDDILMEEESSSGNSFNMYSENIPPERQTFGERYHLSLKYIVIAKCFFMLIKESYLHCNILEKMISDFGELEQILRQESNQVGLLKLNIKK